MRILSLGPEFSQQAAKLAQAAIRETESTYYSAEQVAVWLGRITEQRCGEILRTTMGFGAFDAGELLGFATLCPHKSMIDFLYVCPTSWGLGVGRTLIHAVETEARRMGKSELRVDASKLASPMLLRLGYAVEKLNPKMVEGLHFENQWMLKALT